MAHNFRVASLKRPVALQYSPIIAPSSHSQRRSGRIILVWREREQLSHPRIRSPLELEQMLQSQRAHRTRSSAQPDSSLFHKRLGGLATTGARSWQATESTSIQQRHRSALRRRSYWAWLEMMSGRTPFVDSISRSQPVELPSASSPSWTSETKSDQHSYRRLLHLVWSVSSHLLSFESLRQQ